MGLLSGIGLAKSVYNTIKIKEKVAELDRLLNDKNEEIRHKTIDDIKKEKDHINHLNLLTRNLNNPDPYVRGIAAEILGDMKYSPVVSQLKQIIQNDKNGSVREKATIALKKIKP